MNSKLLLIFIFLLGVLSCSTNIKEYNSKLAIRNDIKELTAIELDTSKFTVLLDSIHNTEGAFDSDYTLFVRVKFDQNYFDSLKQTICSTSYFNVVNLNEDWKVVDTSKIKGVWFIDSASYRYLQKPMESNPEPIYLYIDTVSRDLNLELYHL